MTATAVFFWGVARRRGGGTTLRRMRRRVTIRLDEPTVEYFKELAEETGIPYQTLIKLYPQDCAESKRELNLEWRPETEPAQ